MAPGYEYYYCSSTLNSIACESIRSVHKPANGRTLYLVHYCLAVLGAVLLLYVVCCCSHMISPNQVRGHRAGSSHSGVEAYLREKGQQTKRAHAYIMYVYTKTARRKLSRKSMCSPSRPPTEGRKTKYYFSLLSVFSRSLLPSLLSMRVLTSHLAA